MSKNPSLEVIEKPVEVSNFLSKIENSHLKELVEYLKSEEDKITDNEFDLLKTFLNDEEIEKFLEYEKLFCTKEKGFQELETLKCEKFDKLFLDYEKFLNFSFGKICQILKELPDYKDENDKGVVKESDYFQAYNQRIAKFRDHIEFLIGKDSTESLDVIKSFVASSFKIFKLLFLTKISPQTLAENFPDYDNSCLGGHSVRIDTLINLYSGKDFFAKGFVESYLSKNVHVLKKHQSQGDEVHIIPYLKFLLGIETDKEIAKTDVHYKIVQGRGLGFELYAVVDDFEANFKKYLIERIKKEINGEFLNQDLEKILINKASLEGCEDVVNRITESGENGLVVSFDDYTENYNFLKARLEGELIDKHFANSDEKLRIFDISYVEEDDYSNVKIKINYEDLKKIVKDYKLKTSESKINQVKENLKENLNFLTENSHSAKSQEVKNKLSNLSDLSFFASDDFIPFAIDVIKSKDHENISRILNICYCFSFKDMKGNISGHLAKPELLNAFEEYFNNKNPLSDRRDFFETYKRSCQKDFNIESISSLSTQGILQGNYFFCLSFCKKAIDIVDYLKCSSDIAKYYELKNEFEELFSFRPQAYLDETLLKFKNDATSLFIDLIESKDKINSVVNTPNSQIDMFEKTLRASATDIAAEEFKAFCNQNLILHMMYRPDFALIAKGLVEKISTIISFEEKFSLSLKISFEKIIKDIIFNEYYSPSYISLSYIESIKPIFQAFIDHKDEFKENYELAQLMIYFEINCFKLLKKCFEINGDKEPLSFFRNLSSKCQKDALITIDRDDNIYCKETFLRVIKLENKKITESILNLLKINITDKQYHRLLFSLVFMALNGKYKENFDLFLQKFGEIKIFEEGLYNKEGFEDFVFRTLSSSYTIGGFNSTEKLESTKYMLSNFNRLFESVADEEFKKAIKNVVNKRSFEIVKNLCQFKDYEIIKLLSEKGSLNILQRALLATEGQKKCLFDEISGFFIDTKEDSLLKIFKLIDFKYEDAKKLTLGIRNLELKQINVEEVVFEINKKNLTLVLHENLNDDFLRLVKEELLFLESRNNFSFIESEENDDLYNSLKKDISENVENENFDEACDSYARLVYLFLIPSAACSKVELFQEILKLKPKDFKGDEFLNICFIHAAFYENKDILKIILEEFPGFYNFLNLNSEYIKRDVFEKIGNKIFKIKETAPLGKNQAKQKSEENNEQAIGEFVTKKFQKWLENPKDNNVFLEISVSNLESDEYSFLAGKVLGEVVVDKFLKSKDQEREKCRVLMLILCNSSVSCYSTKKGVVTNIHNSNSGRGGVRSNIIKNLVQKIKGDELDDDKIILNLLEGIINQNSFVINKDIADSIWSLQSKKADLSDIFLKALVQFPYGKDVFWKKIINKLGGQKVEKNRILVNKILYEENKRVFIDSFFKKKDVKNMKPWVIKYIEHLTCENNSNDSGSDFPDLIEFLSGDLILYKRVFVAILFDSERQFDSEKRYLQAIYEKRKSLDFLYKILDKESFKKLFMYDVYFSESMQEFTKNNFDSLVKDDDFCKVISSFFSADYCNASIKVFDDNDRYRLYSSCQQNIESIKKLLVNNYIRSKEGSLRLKELRENLTKKEFGIFKRNFELRESDNELEVESAASAVVPTETSNKRKSEEEFNQSGKKNTKTGGGVANDFKMLLSKQQDDEKQRVEGKRKVAAINVEYDSEEEEYSESSKKEAKNTNNEEGLELAKILVNLRRKEQQEQQPRPNNSAAAAAAAAVEEIERGPAKR
jgi:hypothetical protein